MSAANVAYTFAGGNAVPAAQKFTALYSAPSGECAKHSRSPSTVRPGPIVSGPHETPFVCTTQSFQLYATLGKSGIASDETLGPALDKDCSAKTKITYLYLAKGASVLAPLPSAASLPADVATTTTTTGQSVPFVVRVETATIDRGIYQSTVLFDPTSDQQPAWDHPPRGWNRRLIAVQGAGCPGGWYFQGSTGGSSAPRPGTADASLYSLARLGEGYALYGNTLQNASQNCNAVLEGEAAMMGKEHFIKTFGVPEFTLSTGGSGGAYTSLGLTDAFPGLFDGAFVNLVFPDATIIALSALRMGARVMVVTAGSAASRSRTTPHEEQKFDPSGLRWPQRLQKMDVAPTPASPQSASGTRQRR